MIAPDLKFTRSLGAVPVGSIGFPRASDDESTRYLLSYRVEARPLMLAWLNDRLGGLTYETREQLRRLATQRAEDELGRPLKEFELLVLASAARDWFFAHEIKDRAEARR